MIRRESKKAHALQWADRPYRRCRVAHATEIYTSWKVSEVIQQSRKYKLKAANSISSAHHQKQQCRKTCVLALKIYDIPSISPP